MHFFLESFQALFEEPSSANIFPTTKFKELDEWSSLQALSVIAMVDEEYNIAIKGDDIAKANTVEDLFNTIKGKM